MTDEELEFKKGVRACFDYLLSRTANHYHGNPKLQEICDVENKIIEEWAIDMLEEVDSSSYREWRSIKDAYARGRACTGNNHFANTLSEMRKEDLIKILNSITGNPPVMTLSDSIMDGYTFDVNIGLKPMFIEMGNDETVLGFVNESTDDVINCIIIG